MRLFLLFFFFGLLFTSCENEKPDFQKLIQGNWECNYLDSNGDTIGINMYLKDSIGHFFICQSNDNIFHIENDKIVINCKASKVFRNKGTKQILKIINADRNNLELVSIKGWLNRSFDSIQFDTLKFTRLRKNNDLKIRRITFCSSGCFGTCPSFKMEINKDNSFKFEGFSYTVKDGQWEGNVPSRFWEILKDKSEYLDFKNWNENYSASWTDDQTCSLVLETNSGIFKVSVYGNDKEPRALRNLIQYIFWNYESSAMTKSKNSKIKFAHDEILKGMGLLPEERILEFIPPIK